MKSVILCFLAMLPLLGFGQLDRASALKRGAALFRLLDSKIPDSEMSAIRVEERGADPAEHQLHRWDVSTTYRKLSLNPDNGALLSYSNGHVDGRAPLGPESRGVPASGEPFFSSQAAFVAWARAVLTKIDVPVRVRVDADSLPPPDSQGQVPRQIVTIRFFDRPNGFDTADSANFSFISLDSLTGEVCYLQVVSHYTYPTPVVNITRDAAREIASRAFGIELPLDKVTAPLYSAMNQRDELSESGRSFASNHVVPLSYAVQYTEVNADRHTVAHRLQISCDTGEILDRFSGVLGNVVPSDPPSGRSASSTRNQSGSVRATRDVVVETRRVPLAVLLGLAAIVGAVLVAGIRNRRREAQNPNPDA